MCPPGPLFSVAQDGLGVGDEVAVNDVADPAFQRTNRGFRGVSFGAFAVVEGAAGTVRVEELGDRGDVQRVVQTSSGSSRTGRR